MVWLIAAVCIAAIGTAGITVVVSYAVGATAPTPTQGGTPPFVGGDLHVLASFDDGLYVGGHGGAARSSDAGRSWSPLTSLEGADPMGWASTDGGMLVGGHPGLFRSTDGGTTFTMLTGANAVSDVHAIGGTGATVYLASPVAGFLASVDGGATWEVRNTRIGPTFMGTLLVDPANPELVIAPDMSNGLIVSSDGGATWRTLGGPGGTMSAAWDPSDRNRIVSIGMGESAITTDGGKTWTPMQVPDGTSAAVFSLDGGTLFTGVLSGTGVAVVSMSNDDGKTWTKLG